MAVCHAKFEALPDSESPESPAQCGLFDGASDEYGAWGGSQSRDELYSSQSHLLQTTSIRQNCENVLSKV